MPSTSTPSREARPAIGAEHRDAMVAVGVDRAAAKSAVSLDPHPVLGRLDLAAERGQRLGDGGDPVDLLAAQLGGVADRRRSLGEAGGERDQRQLVDRQGDFGAADLGAAQLARGGRGSWPIGSPPALALRLDLDLGAHPLEDREQAGAGRVEADAAQRSTSLPGTSSAATRKKAAEEKSAGTTICRRLEPLRGPDGDARRHRGDLGAGGGEHALGVVAARQRLDAPGSRPRPAARRRAGRT